MSAPLAEDADDIVVVDDDALTLELIRRSLRGTDLKLRCFTDELSALSYLESHATRVLIVDQRMPRLDGLELLLRLANGAGAGAGRVYLCSAVQLPERIRAGARKLGARMLSKDVFRSKTAFLELLDKPQRG